MNLINQLQRTPTESFYVFAGSILALLGVALGAFGSHVLKSVLTEEMLSTFETAVRYQFYHALALIIFGLLGNGKLSDRTLVWGGAFMLTGVLLFSGSLYAYIATETRFFAFLTPIGGVSLIFAWMILSFGAFRKMRKRAN